MKLYWASGSPYAWRAMLALEIKRAPYEAHLVSFSKREHRTPEYLAMNPRGKVPVLRDGDFVIYESLGVMAYVDRMFPEPPLFGRSAQEHGRIWQLVSELGSYLEVPLLTRVTSEIFFRPRPDTAGIEEAMARVHYELERYEEMAEATEWLAGDAISAADLVLYPLVQLGLRAAGKEAARELNIGLLPLDETYPALAAWARRIEAVPGYDRTYPPHWR